MQKIIGRNAYAVAARGAEVYLSDGRRLLDLGTWATTVLGHAPPGVVAAVIDQCTSLPTTARGLANASTPLLAKSLIDLAQPSRLQRVWFGANGADVVEATLKLARIATGRLRVLAVEGGFHGRTLGAMAVSHGDRYRGPLEPLLGGVSFIKVTPDAVEREVSAGDVAAVIFEVIRGGASISSPDVDILRRWTHAAHIAGAMVIVDEIQTGLWRCGAFSLALSLGLDPDAILLGKTLGGGVVPLSAALCTSTLTEELEHNPYFHSQTFSGHPLACAAGIAALRLLPETVATNSARIEAWLAVLRSRLQEVSEPTIDAQVYGLMMSLAFSSPDLANQFIMAAARRGILLCPVDGDRSIVRVLAPLVLQESQMSEVSAILGELCARPDLWQAHFVAPAIAEPHHPRIAGP